MMDWSTLHWPGGAPWWLLVLVAAVLGWALVRRHHDLTEKLPPRRVWLLQGLRGLLYAAIVFFLAGPTLIDKRERSLPPKLLVLVDSSASMSVQDANRKKSRIDLAKDFLLVPKKPGKSQTPRRGGAGRCADEPAHRSQKVLRRATRPLRCAQNPHWSAGDRKPSGQRRGQ